MRIWKHFAFWLFFCGATTLAAPAGKIVDRMVANVNGHVLLQSDWEEELSFEAFLDARSPDSFSPEERKAALDRLIDQELLREEVRPSEETPGDQIAATEFGRGYAVFSDPDKSDSYNRGRRTIKLHQWIARMGQPLYGFQTPTGYSDTAESWVNTGGLLERMNFGLALASNRIPGTRVDLNRFVDGTIKSAAIDQTKVMDEFLGVLLAGDISPKTRETLLKQLNQQAVVSIPVPVRQVEPLGDMAQMDGPGSQQRQRLRMEANINDPVTKIVGLILGLPEFQRQ